MNSKDQSSSLILSICQSETEKTIKKVSIIRLKIIIKRAILQLLTKILAMFT